MTSATPPHLAARTTGIRPTFSGIGRTSSAARHVDASASSTRVDDERLSINATMMMTARIGSMRNGLEALKPIAISRMPSTTAFTPMASRFVIRPSTSAASARSRTPIESAPNTGRPMMPARRKMAMNAMSAATDHTRVCSRLTGMPRSAARSALSALALIAMPTLLMRKNIARPSSVKGATIMAITSFASNTTVPIVSSMSNGGARRCPRSGKSSPQARGSRIASPPRS